MEACAEAALEEVEDLHTHILHTVDVNMDMLACPLIILHYTHSHTPPTHYCGGP